MTRSYYSNKIQGFLDDDINHILSTLVQNHHFPLEEQQRNSWLQEITILKQELKTFVSGHIIFEYSIPRMGKRADVILILNGLVFVIEFKVNEKQYKNSDIDQCLDYVLDLKYFHKQSNNAKLVPILLATHADNFNNSFEPYDDQVFKPIRCNRKNIDQILSNVCKQFDGSYLDPIEWENSIYRPTPTIIEAAQAMYQGHDVREIAQSESGAENLINITNAINNIIEESKKQNLKLYVL